VVAQGHTEHDGADLHAVVPYDRLWSARFEQVAQELRRRIPGVLAVHHVGSTAVRGLAGRNIIDVELVVDPSVPECDWTTALTGAGYERFEPPDLTADGVCLFIPRDESTRTHVHVYPDGSSQVTRHLAVRDYLRNHPDQADEYARVKQAAAQAAAGDRAGYSSAKASFVRELQKRALAWADPLSR
jgi:GrpB-like predicted nucleotidyltransferase (UPF0157 family)